ncbi:MAG: cation:dicarboxylase symporter family transporter [Spirochaetaceae bacterium]|jgi:Na+/H+-dicarboxylate symporter|nr:cation:dicarboxylase symporter family transporter [Spirochaetaceae bacterium]
MKIWMKFLLGALLGICLGFLLPDDNETIRNILVWFEALSIRIGRYTLAPILIFSLIIALYELQQDGHFWKLFFSSFLVIIGSGVFVIAVGIIVTLVFPPARIPILVEEQVESISLYLPESVMELFPSNAFSVLINEGVFLLPMAVFVFFFAIGLSYDRNYTKPVIAMVDSLSRIFYYAASFFSEILGVVIIALSAYWAFRYHVVLRANMFRDLIVLLGLLSGILGFVILPLFLFFLKPKTNPLVAVYGSLGPALAAFFSGDINFTLPVMLRHAKENLGARRRSNVVTVTLFSIFGRAGSAMVATIAFIVIIRSYSSLGITLADVFSIGIRALLISFALFQHPGKGAYTTLAILSIGYGRGFEAGYLILKPLAFYLIAVGTFLDVMIMSLATYALAKINGFQVEKGPRHFI